MVPWLGSMSSNLWEPAVACNGNIWSPGWGTMTSNLWEPAVPCNGNLRFPGWEPGVPTSGNRQFLAMNQTQTFRYRSIKQNKAFCTGPLSKTKKNVKKLFSYHFDMHLFCAKTFFCRPNSQTQTFRYRSIKQNKRFCYRLSKQNKTTLRTMIFIFLESTDPSTGNVCFFRLGTMSFKLWEPAVPYNDSRLASKT